MSDACGNFRPYSNSTYTKHFGCVNCGSLAHFHKDICHFCGGTGRQEKAPEPPQPILKSNTKEPEYVPELTCESCVGTGRQSCVNAFDNI